MSRPARGVVSCKTRIHGELFRPLAAQAEAKAQPLSEFLAAVIAQSIAGCEPDKPYGYHEFSDAFYLRTGANIHAAAKAKEVRITLPQKDFAQFERLITGQLAQDNRQKPAGYHLVDSMPAGERAAHGEYPAYRDYKRAYRKCFRNIVTSILTEYCMEHGLID